MAVKLTVLGVIARHEVSYKKEMTVADVLAAKKISLKPDQIIVLVPPRGSMKMDEKSVVTIDTVVPDGHDVVVLPRPSNG